MKRGRPKGYSPYISISYDELGDYVGRRTIVKVSKSWLEEMQAQCEPNEITDEIIEDAISEPQEKIEYRMTEFDD
jgi:hypothetical protein|tara:strand:+ start:1190 stop:1414 length:225 start_codon:yes stop_codon:yes gene_type:complete